MREKPLITTDDNKINKKITNIFRKEKKKDPYICPKKITLEMLSKAMGASTKKGELNDVGRQVINKNLNGLWAAYYVVMGLAYLDEKIEYIDNKGTKSSEYDPKLNPFNFDEKK